MYSDVSPYAPYLFNTSNLIAVATRTSTQIAKRLHTHRAGKSNERKERCDGENARMREYTVRRVEELRVQEDRRWQKLSSTESTCNNYEPFN